MLLAAHSNALAIRRPRLRVLLTSSCSLRVSGNQPTLAPDSLAETLHTSVEASSPRHTPGWGDEPSLRWGFLAQEPPPSDPVHELDVRAQRLDAVAVDVSPVDL